MCFLIKKIFDDDKKYYLYDRFFVSNRNFTTENVKIFLNSWFFHQNSRFFSKYLKFQVFPGKVATLCGALAFTPPSRQRSYEGDKFPLSNSPV